MLQLDDADISPVPAIHCVISGMKQHFHALDIEPLRAVTTLSPGDSLIVGAASRHEMRYQTALVPTLANASIPMDLGLIYLSLISAPSPRPRVGNRRRWVPREFPGIIYYRRQDIDELMRMISVI